MKSNLRKSSTNNAKPQRDMECNGENKPRLECSSSSDVESDLTVPQTKKADSGWHGLRSSKFESRCKESSVDMKKPKQTKDRIEKNESNVVTSMTDRKKTLPRRVKPETEGVSATRAAACKSSKEPQRAKSKIDKKRPSWEWL